MQSEGDQAARARLTSDGAGRVLQRILDLARGAMDVPGAATAAPSRRALPVGGWEYRERCPGAAVADSPTLLAVAVPEGRTARGDTNHPDRPVPPAPPSPPTSSATPSPPPTGRDTARKQEITAAKVAASVAGAPPPVRRRLRRHRRRPAARRRRARRLSGDDKPPPPGGAVWQWGQSARGLASGPAPLRWPHRRTRPVPGSGPEGATRRSIFVAASRAADSAGRPRRTARTSRSGTPSSGPRTGVPRPS